MNGLNRQRQPGTLLIFIGKRLFHFTLPEAKPVYDLVKRSVSMRTV